MVDGVFKRGKKGLYTARLQVPTQFQNIVKTKEVWQATGTSNYEEAVEFRITWKRRKMAEWNALLAGRQPNQAKSRFKLAAELAVSRGEDYRTAENLSNMNLEEILGRVERLQAMGDGPESVAAQAILGGIEMPKMSLKEVAMSMPERFPEDWKNKTARGKKVWESRWLRPADKFINLVGKDPEFISIDRQSAISFRDALKDRVLDDDDYKAESAMTELQNLNGLWKRHHEALGIDPEEVPPSPWRNLASPLYKLAEGDGQKLEIPIANLEMLIAPNALDGMNEEERDIIYVLVETGGRQSEITDIPPGSIHLCHAIPHIEIKNETGEFARTIKNKPSKRKIPLVGVALQAMRRHPDGFARYRGKGTFSAAANAFLHENGLLPEEITIGGTRHSYEARMKRAGYDNDDRGAMMGHSIKRIRGREVYGDPLSLEEKLAIAEAIRLRPGKR
ncbi:MULTISPECIES: DUF6538 domain-containing protein [unclassified Sulfitobacter]|uniref:DUF6538 domain-containing protein n=1 Tax=unclassified Sulfitobacter TaxID=196795 RepID=UPI0021A8883E|nr:DUF6538 domain-containing protein [Sulfitobacter sp. W074]UWR38641.1 hypothetical protein K3762_06365 [Sulfitobacter sp. W074]